VCGSSVFLSSKRLRSAPHQFSVRTVHLAVTGKRDSDAPISALTGIQSARRCCGDVPARGRVQRWRVKIKRGLVSAKMIMACRPATRTVRRYLRAASRVMDNVRLAFQGDVPRGGTESTSPGIICAPLRGPWPPAQGAIAAGGDDGKAHKTGIHSAPMGGDVTTLGSAKGRAGPKGRAGRSSNIS